LKGDNMGLFDSKEERQRKQVAKEQQAALEAARKQQQDTDMAFLVSEIESGEIRFNGPTDVALAKNENLLMASPSTSLVEARAVRQGTYGGPRIRIAKGFSIGGGASRYESHDELRTIDTGNFTVTSERIVFAGSLRTVSIKLKKVVGLEPIENGVGINHTGKQKTQYFLFPELRINFKVENRVYDTLLVSPEMISALINGAVKRAI